jgi:hypothetical protein
MSAIEFRSVDKIYRGRRVIDSVSFMIEGGERIRTFRTVRLRQIDNTAAYRRAVAAALAEGIP